MNTGVTTIFTFEATESAAAANHSDEAAHQPATITATATAKPKKITLNSWSKEWLDHERYLTNNNIIETEDGRYIKDMNKQDVQEMEEDKKR